MLKTKSCIAVLLFSFCFFSSCKKSVDLPANPVNPSTQTDTYLAGTFTNNSGKSVAFYSKNDSITALSDGTKNEEAASIFVTGNDIYVVGWESNPSGITRAKYWKNGTPVFLSNRTKRSDADGIFINQNDVYICGSETYSNFTTPVYWKNGIEFNLSDTNNYGGASKIIYSGNDQYICGSLTLPGQSQMPVYWKNGNLVVLNNGQLNGMAFNIGVSGTDVYVCGEEFRNIISPIATYWKNGIKQRLIDDSTTESNASGIFINNSDVYFAGTHLVRTPPTYYSGLYWKNGTANYMPNSNLDFTHVYDIALKNDTVITVGVRGNGLQSKLAYWKNGVETLLGHEGVYTRIRNIFIK